MATYLIIYFWKAKVFCFLVIRFDNIKEFDFRYTKFIYLHCGEETKEILAAKNTTEVGRALHRYRRGHGFKYRTGLNFFRSYFQLFVSLLL